MMLATGTRHMFEVDKPTAINALRFIAAEARNMIATIEASPHYDRERAAERKDCQRWRAADEKSIADYAALVENRTAKKEQYIRDQAEIFKTKVRGRDVGDIWHSELESYRGTGAFEAVLCDLLIKSGIPAADVKVRNFVKAKDLAEMVRMAQAAARKLEAA
jgi:hypothetical protein